MARPRKNTLTMKQYLENIRDGYISNDADTQRNPAWKPIVDGLAVTILTDDYVPPIILAEEDCGQIHICDGGSRTAAYMMLRYGNYKIKLSVENSIIPYKKRIKDSNGKITWEDAEFDIRNKRFDQFPEELQKKFDEYQVEMVIHEHCTKEMIAMYIKRYNEHKAMSTNQKMFTYIPKFAEKIRDITNKKMFVDCSNIKDSDKENGILERIVVETIMCISHFDKWKKDGKKIATYLNDSSCDEEFESLSNEIARLETIITNETKCLFDSKDTFIWLTLFDKFSQTGLDDSRFAEFLTAFINELRNKSVDGKLFDTVDETGSTKDKVVIKDKLYILESLMNEYLHINTEETENITTEEFISKVVDMPLDEVKADIDLYKDSLADLENNTIKDGSRLLEVANNLSLLAMVAYSYKNDIDLDDWMIEYAASNNMYIKDQAKNFLHMVQNYKEYQSRM